MNQSSLMAGALLAGFVVYLAMNGKLAAYWSILIGGGSGSAASSATGSGSAATSSSTSTASAGGLPSSLAQYLGGTGLRG